MSELQRSGSRLPRKAREERAYRLVLATGTLAVVTVVGFVLAVAGVIGGGVPFVTLALASVAGVLLWRTVRG